MAGFLNSTAVAKLFRALATSKTGESAADLEQITGFSRRALSRHLNAYHRHGLIYIAGFVRDKPTSNWRRVWKWGIDRTDVARPIPDHPMARVVRYRAKKQAEREALKKPDNRIHRIR